MGSPEISPHERRGVSEELAGEIYGLGSGASIRSGPKAVPPTRPEWRWLAFDIVRCQPKVGLSAWILLL